MKEYLKDLNSVRVEWNCVAKPARLTTRRCRIALAVIFFGSPVFQASGQLAFEESNLCGEGKSLEVSLGSAAVEMI